MIIAIYDISSGAIKQVTTCTPENGGQQHLHWPEHDWIEIYDPKVTPHSHKIDLKTLKPLALPVTPPAPLLKDKVTAGFSFNDRTYPSNPTDQANMVQVATVGGKLYSADAAGEWTLDEYTAAEGAAILRAFIDFKDALREQ